MTVCVAVLLLTVERVDAFIKGLLYSHENEMNEYSYTQWNES
jgi:hypothetical protein